MTNCGSTTQLFETSCQKRPNCLVHFPGLSTNCCKQNYFGGEIDYFFRFAPYHFFKSRNDLHNWFANVSQMPLCHFKKYTIHDRCIFLSTPHTAILRKNASVGVMVVFFQPNAKFQQAKIGDQIKGFTEAMFFEWSKHWEKEQKMRSGQSHFFLNHKASICTYSLMCWWMNFVQVSYWFVLCHPC